MRIVLLKVSISLLTTEHWVKSNIMYIYYTLYIEITKASKKKSKSNICQFRAEVRKNASAEVFYLPHTNCSFCILNITNIYLRASGLRVSLGILSL